MTTKYKTTSNRLNLTIDKDFGEILTALKSKYPLLKEVELIKMAVSGYYTDHKDEFTKFVENRLKGVEISKNQIKNGEYTVLKSEEDIESYMENL